MIKNVFVLALTILVFGCSSNDDSPSNSSEVNGSEYVYFMSGKINGEPFIYGQRTDATVVDYTLGLSNTLGAICAYYPETGGYNYNTFVYPNFDNENRPTMGLEFVRFHLCTDDQYQHETFNEKFPVDSYDFAVSNDGVNGSTGDIGLSFSPNAQEGPYYDTYGGDQNGSYFNITSSTSANSYILDVLVGSAQIIEGNFSAKFYNEEDSSDVIIITEGQFKMIPSLQ